MTASDWSDWREWRDGQAATVAVVVADDGSGALALHDDSADRQFGVWLDATEFATAVDELEARIGPRWVWWSKTTASSLLAIGVRPRRCWDLGAVHRLLTGGWRADPARVWAHLHQLDPATIPSVQPLDLFHQVDDSGDETDPIRRDGHLRPEWVDGAWNESPERRERWAALAMEAFRLQAATADDPDTRTELRHLGRQRRGHRRATAFCESAAEMLCAELEHDGLPFDRAVAEELVAGIVGPRPRTQAEDDALLARRDRAVLQHLPAGVTADLRSADQIKSLLRRVGIEVPDTRAWRLERLRGTHPLIEPLLDWRRAERIRTTFGYRWIDDHVGHDGRLRGSWSGADGAAGRMTATAGLHNMPAELRPAIVAEAGHVFVRADLGQIEPRVLAAVSGDPALAAATAADDMYAPVAERLRVDREIAKVAVLGAMYGQTTGKGAEALRGLEREYPVAMGYLRAADEAAQGGHDLSTYGGRRLRMSGSSHAASNAARDLRSRVAARGRFGRNAVVQGAAAEFFKTWAVLVRARGAASGARIVLCLHDELLVHVVDSHGDNVASLLDECLQEAAHRWAPPAERPVRFVADVSVITRWSDAKTTLAAPS